jgi:hypothetical protein
LFIVIFRNTIFISAVIIYAVTYERSMGTFQLHKFPISFPQFTIFTSWIHIFNIRNSQIHDFSFMNSRFQLHELTISASWIHDFNFTNSRLKRHEFMISWRWNREFVKMKSWNHGGEIHYLLYSDSNILILFLYTVNLNIEWTFF